MDYYPKHVPTSSRDGALLISGKRIESVAHIFHFRKLLLFLLLLTLYLPIDMTFPNININIHDSVLFVIGLSFVSYILVGKRYHLRVFDKVILLPVIGFILYAVFQLFYVTSRLLVLITVIQLLEIAVLVFVLSDSKFLTLSDRDIYNILRIFFYFSLTGAIITTIYALITGLRFEGVWGVWFAFGSLSYGFFYSLYHCIFAEGKKYYIFPLAIFTMAIILSLTRGRWISILLSIFFIFLTHRKASGKRIQGRIIGYLAAFFIIFAVTIYTFEIPSRITDRFYSIFYGTQQRDLRFYGWQAAMEMFVDHPLGVGLGNYRYHSIDYAHVHEIFEGWSRRITREKGSRINGPRMEAHGDWFLILAEAGIIGVVLYAIFWFRIMKHVVFRRFQNIYTLITATFLVSIFANAVINSIFYCGGGGIAIVFIYFIYIRTLTMKFETGL